MKILFFVFPLLIGAEAQALSHPIDTKRTLSVDAVKNQLMETVKRDFVGAARFQIESIYIPENVPAQALLQNIKPQPPFGMVTFELNWMEYARRRQAFGNAHVKAFCPIAIAKADIRNGDTLSEENVHFKEKELTPFLHTGFFRDLKDVSGLIANGMIKAGTVLGMVNTHTPLAINRGQTADLIYEQKALRITAKVRALENGRINDWIRVENPDSKKVFQARISAAGELRLR